MLIHFVMFFIILLFGNIGTESCKQNSPPLMSLGAVMNVVRLVHGICKRVNFNLVTVV
jgi:hypothetical protein